MKKIGIIAAMNEEINEVKNIMTNISEKQIYELIFIEGNINNKECVIVQSGIGKVNAARTTQILIDNYNLEYIVNVGSAASLNDKLNIGDIVIGEKLIQHDFDITAFGHNKGYISNVGEYIQSDTMLVKKIYNCCSNNKIEDIKIKSGVIASGDIFCTSEEMKNKINNKFKADAVEMEGAAIAQVCYLDKIPFVVIRSISDTPNGNNNITFDKFLVIASKRCANIINQVI